MQNGFAESFNGRMRDELLNETVFTSLLQAHAVIADWVADYNTTRPHSALGYQTPAAYAAKLKAMGPASPPLRGSEPGPIAHTAPDGVTSAGTLPMAGWKFHGRSVKTCSTSSPSRHRFYKTSLRQSRGGSDQRRGGLMCRAKFGAVTMTCNINGAQKPTESLSPTSFRLSMGDCVVVLLTSFVILLPLVFRYGITDDEDVDISIIPSLLTWHSILSGGSSLWSGSIALGAPIHFVTRMAAAPFSLLYVAAPFAATSLVVFVIHVIIGQIAVIRLFSLVGVYGWLRRSFLIVYSITQSVSVLIMLPVHTYLMAATLPPVLAWIAILIRQARFRSEIVFFASLFSLVFSYILSSSLVSISVPILSMFAIFSLIVCINRTEAVVAICVALAFSVMMNSILFYTLVSEAMLFPDYIAIMRQHRTTDNANTVAYMIRELIVLPFLRPSGGELLAAFGADGILGIFKMLVDKLSVRENFNWGVMIGHPILLLAFSAPFLSYPTPLRASLSVTFLSGLAITLFVPSQALFSLANSMGDFAMAGVIFGLLLVAPHLAAIQRAGLPGSRAFIAVTLTITVASILVVQIPDIRVAYSNIVQGSAFKGALGKNFLTSEFRGWLSDLFPEKGRVYITADANEAITYSGYISANSLSLEGYDIVTAVMKGILLDDLYPLPVVTPSGTVWGHGVNARNKDFLDVLGIAIVAVPKGEPVHSSLQWRGDFTVSNGAAVSFYHNPGAWRRAFAVSGFTALHPVRRVDCPNDRLLCADFAPLREARIETAVSVKRDGGDIVVTVAKSPEEQHVIVTEYFRPGWRATSPHGPVGVSRVFGSLIGVTVPPGVEQFRLSYAPRGLVASMMFSICATAVTVLICLAAWIVSRRANRSVSA